MSTRVAVQPCGDSDAKEHYVDTIENLVPASRVIPHLNANERLEFDAACGSQVAVWGVTPGVSGGNKTKWERLAPGDVVLLYRNKRLFSKARI